MAKKLYIEYRVYFDATTNQELLREVAEQAQEHIYDLFANEDSPIPAVHDVTFELVMAIGKDETNG